MPWLRETIKKKKTWDYHCTQKMLCTRSGLLMHSILYLISFHRRNVQLCCDALDHHQAKVARSTRYDLPTAILLPHGSPLALDHLRLTVERDLAGCGPTICCNCSVKIVFCQCRRRWVKVMHCVVIWIWN